MLKYLVVPSILGLSGLLYPACCFASDRSPGILRSPPVSVQSHFATRPGAPSTYAFLAGSKGLADAAPAQSSAILKAAQDSVRRLGIATPFNDLRDLSEEDLNTTFENYATLGVGWLRTDFYWDQVQSDGADSFDWTEIDRVVSAAERHGIRVIGLLNGTPDWVGQSGGMLSAANIRMFAEFARVAALRYRNIRVWEIWNEPNLQGTWETGPDPAAYTKTLKAAFTAIKAVDPTVIILSAGLSAVPSTDLLGGRHHYSATQFLAGMYANGAKGYFDAVAFHPYTWPYMPDNNESWSGWAMMKTGIRSIMEANGDSAKKVWITELGAPTNEAQSGVSQQSQAKILEMAYTFACNSPWIGPLMWYSYKDHGTSETDTESWYGLVGPNGERKPAYDVYRELAKKDEGVVIRIPDEVQRER